MEFGLGWFGIAVFVALIAVALKRSGLIWFLIGAAIGPIAFIVLLIMGRNDNEVEPQDNGRGS